VGWGPKAPDMTAQNEAAKAQTAIAQENQGMMREQIAYQREQDALYSPMFRQMIDAQIASQQTADQRSEDQWQRYMAAFAPAENKLSEQAMGYDTPGRQAQAASEAVAGVDAQYGRAREAQQRDLNRAGVSLDSGRSLTLDMANRFGQARAGASADRTARQQVELTGMNLVDNVAKLGRGLAGTSLQAQGLGLQAGGAAGSGINQSAAFHNAGLQPALQFGQAATSGLSSAASIYGNVAQQQQQASNATMNGLLGIGKLAATLYTSDPKAKKVHGKVDDKKALAQVDATPVKSWTYKPGLGDGGSHIGRMAGKGDVSTPNGKAIDVISEMGLHQAAIRGLSQKVARLEKAMKKDTADDSAEGEKEAA